MNRKRGEEWEQGEGRRKNERVVICHGKRPFSQYYFPQSVINCSHISPFSLPAACFSFFFSPPSLPPPPPAPLLFVLSRCSLFLFLIVNSARSFRRLTTAVTRSYLAEISAVETLWFSTNAKTERLHGHGKRAGIKRKIKRRITLFHVYRMWMCIGEQPLHFRIYTVRFFFFLFFLFLSFFFITRIFGNFYRRSRKMGDRKRRGRR